MTFAGDLKVGATSLSTFGTIADFAGVYSEGPLRGGNLTIPGVAGDTYLPKVRGAYDFTVPLVLRASVVGDRSEILATLDSLATLLDSSTAALTLTRVRPQTGGGTVDETCTGEYVSGLEPEFVGFRAGRVAIVLRNLSGVWT